MEVITRDLLSLVMVITMDIDNLMTNRTVIIIMDMARGLLSLVMALHMFMWSRRTMDMATQSLMSMDTTFIRGQLNLDMDQMKVTKKFPILHTPIMISKCTTLTKWIEIVPHFIYM